MTSTRTRFAPSPTGYLHIGGARTALFAWLHARRHGGEFLLRIEDTDRQRSSDDLVSAILDGLRWLGLDWDADPIYQYQRLSRYQDVLHTMLADNHAYVCDCDTARLEALREAQLARREKPRYDGRCRHRNLPLAPERVVRLRAPTTGYVSFVDHIKGVIRIDNSELDDLVLLRADGTPTYNFAVVVDDHDSHITDVIRGDDHISNTPRQMHIYRALGWVPPQFAHVPMILGDDGARLSKRHGATSVLAYRDGGYLPEAVINALARCGWSHGDREFFSLDELHVLFDISAVHSAAARLDVDKLRWFNEHYLRELPLATIVSQLRPFMTVAGSDEQLTLACEMQRQRASTLRELADHCSIFFIAPVYQHDAAAKLLQPAHHLLSSVMAQLTALTVWDNTSIHAVLQRIAAELCGGRFGAVGKPLRYALTGGTPSGDLSTVMLILGKNETLARVRAATEYSLQLA